jgi:uncharacterized protein
MAADPSTLVIGGGFGLAFAFGVAAQRSNFCTMGALSDVVNMAHWGRLRMWLLAVAVAIAGTTWLSQIGWVDLSRSVQQRPLLPWLSLSVGGLLFGIGMTLAGGCANRNLLRLGSGSLRSLVVLLVMAVAGYMTLKGLFGQWRADWLDPVALDLAALGWHDQSLGTALAQTGLLGAGVALPLTAAAVVLALLVFVFMDARFRRTPVQWSSGLLLGALVVAAWALSGHFGFGESPETLEDVYFATNSRGPESLSFVGPLAYGLELLLLWTDRSLHATLGIAAVLGVVAGAAAQALFSGSFRWEGFASLADLRAQLIGAVLMGFGGVTALGCTIGQGLSGLSTLALGSFIAVAAIVAGCVATLHYLIWREG